MKALLMVFTFLLLTSIAQASASNPPYNKLSCTGANGDHVVISGLGTETLTVSAGFDPMEIQATSDGDCKNRKTFCHEEGQWMINIPWTLMGGERPNGHIWVNSDTDDRPENHRLGDRYDCTAD